MTLQDFTKDGFDYLSNDKFLFKNDKFNFYYRLKLSYHEYQEGWDKNYKTMYQIWLIVDEKYQYNKNGFSIDGFILKEVTKKGKFNEEQAEKVLQSALRLKIENKITGRTRKTIKFILTGK